jgi:hypothetical protein
MAKEVGEPSLFPITSADYADSYCPYRNLCAAVLTRAILDYRNEDEANHAAQKSATHFFKSPISGNGEYLSFLDICEALDLCPNTILLRLEIIDTSVLSKAVPR